MFFFKGPKSYTGENVVEISCHGGLVVINQILKLCDASEEKQVFVKNLKICYN